MKIAYLVFFLFAISIQSCHVIAPDPSNQEVKDMTIYLCKSHIQDILVQGVAPRVLGIPAKTIAFCGYPELKYKAWLDLYEEAVHGKKPDSDINKVIETVDEAVSKLEFRLENIRIDHRNYSARRTDFSATLYLNKDTRLDLSAYAQYTTDQKIWVQLTSLDIPGAGLY